MKPPALANVALNTTAKYSTQVNLVVSEDGWRISFGEPTDANGTAVYHTAVYLPTQVAHQLTELLVDTRSKQTSAAKA